jgi:hypothetical protein
VTQSSYRPARFVLAAAVFFPAVLVLAGGCGPDYKARGVVSGKVTVGKNKTPLTAGTVVFQNANGVSASGAIDTEGNYTVADAPVGDCTITVSVPEGPRDPAMVARMKGKMKMPGGVEGSVNPDGGPGIDIMGKMPANIVRIDAKYAKPDTSGLKYKVEKNEKHVHNIEL